MSKKFGYCQTPVQSPDFSLGLGVDFVITLSQEEEQEEQEKEPPPKSIRRGFTRSLKFDTLTTHGLLAKLRGLEVQRTHVTIRTTTRP